MSNLWLIVSHKEVALAQGWVISEKGPLTGTCDVKWNTALIAVSHTCGRLFVESGLDKLLPHSWWSRTASAKSSATCAISSSRRLYREDRWSPGWCWELGCLCAECHRQLCCTPPLRAAYGHGERRNGGVSVRSTAPKYRPQVLFNPSK